MRNPATALIGFFVRGPKAHTGRLFVLAALVSVALAPYPVVHYVATGEALPQPILDYLGNIIFWLPATFGGAYVARRGTDILAKHNGGGNAAAASAAAQAPTGDRVGQ